MTNILGIIPARGGSRGIPRKNIRLFGGKPLLAWTVEVAKGCALIDRVILSTDDAEIADVGRQFGVEVPFMRPSEIAREDTPDYPVFAHALEWLERNEQYKAEIVVWLRPTAPLRQIEDVETCIKLLQSSNADAVRTVCPVEHHPYWMKKLEGNKLAPFVDGLDEAKFYRRQTLPPVYRLNGAVDVTRCASALQKKALFAGDVRGHVMPIERSHDLDTELDFELADAALRRINA